MHVESSMEEKLPGTFDINTVLEIATSCTPPAERGRGKRDM